MDGADYSLVEQMVPTGFFHHGREVEFPIIRRPREDDYILGPMDMAHGHWAIRWVLPPDWAGVNVHDGEWTARWPHERVEHDGYEVPLYAPDPERAAFYADERRVLAQRRWRVLHWFRPAWVGEWVMGERMLLPDQDYIKRRYG